MLVKIWQWSSHIAWTETGMPEPEREKSNYGLESNGLVQKNKTNEGATSPPPLNF